MNFREFQCEAKRDKTKEFDALYPDSFLARVILAKHYHGEIPRARKEEICEELAANLLQISQCCDELHVSLDDLAVMALNERDRNEHSN